MIKKTTNNLYNILISFIIFLIPTNIFLKLFETTAYVNGLRVDYLITKIYLSDIFIFIILFLWFLSNHFKNIIKYKLLIFIVVLLSLRQLWSDYQLASIIYLLRIIGIGLLLIFILKNKKIIKKKIINQVVLITLLFQSIISLYQYINQKSLFGYLLLGEPNLSNYAGIAKSTLFGVEKILPYGTTAHPNILGGFIAIYLLYTIKNLKKEKLATKNIFKYLVICLSTLILLLTQSISAIITFIIGLFLIIYQQHHKLNITLKKLFITITVLLFISIIAINFLSKEYSKNNSLIRRSYLNDAALKMTSNNILIGVGLNNFTSQVENFSPNKEVVRFVQPVHNVFLLFFAENGFLGVLIIFTLISKYSNTVFKKNNQWTLVLLPISLLDHYLITLNTGLLLSVFAIGFLSNLATKPTD